VSVPEPGMAMVASVLCNSTMNYSSAVAARETLPVVRFECPSSPSLRPSCLQFTKGNPN
jgi:hypothetical protein